ncbi:hypothetical protein ASC76_10285 [Rhizobacter sp. Root404]|nr:hypothetical protein ASC76_10285 [Rhizobacter sp. Root404]
MNAASSAEQSLPRNTILLICCAGLVSGLALGSRHVQGLFMLPLLGEHGWGRETFSFAMGIQALVWGLAQPLTGLLADKFGTRNVILGGCVIYATGLVMEALAGTTTLLALGAGAVVGIGLTATSFAVVYGAVSRLVEPRFRGTAQGMSGAVGGVVTFLMVPFTQLGIDVIGWSNTLQVLAVAILIASACAWVLDDRSAGPGERTSPDVAPPVGPVIAAAWRHSGFWLLNLGFISCGFQLAFLATHLPAYLKDAGMSAQAGVNAIAIIALANAGGTYLFGRLGDAYRTKYVLATLYTIRTLSMIAFVATPLSEVSLYIFVLVIGATWLGTAPLTMGILTQIFGVRYIATLFGMVFMGHQLGGFAGSWLGGIFYDRTQSYSAMWAISIGLGVASILLNLPIRDQSVESRFEVKTV